jgi:hypothetical protein
MEKFNSMVDKHSSLIFEEMSKNIKSGVNIDYQLDTLMTRLK